MFDFRRFYVAIAIACLLPLTTIIYALSTTGVVNALFGTQAAGRGGGLGGAAPTFKLPPPTFSVTTRNGINIHITAKFKKFPELFFCASTN